MKNLINYFFVFLIVPALSFGQKSESFFQKIEDIGQNYIQALKLGKIENLKKANPPKDTWTYSKLLLYKSTLKTDKESISYGNFIEESINKKGVYAFNFFALNVKKKEPYFFVAVISIDTNESQMKIKNTYLFTEKESLKDWWKHVYGFYMSEFSKNIPKKFLCKVPPPPPFSK